MRGLPSGFGGPDFMDWKGNAMLTAELKGRIDKLFADFDRPETPGLALGVFLEGELFYARGYGIANLEYDIPVTEKTVFHVASMAKQFTAMSIALLEEQGLVGLEDDIRTYFPELPSYPWPVTLGHLVYMTNGLYDIYNLANFSAGIRENDHFTVDQAWEYVKACDWLMFKPGKKWCYGNTGYFLLAQLVERVTGQNLSEFADKNIFAPLKMNQTFFRDDSTGIIKNRAESYSDYDHVHYNTAKKPWTTRGHKILINADQMEIPGAGQLWTTVEDLFLWDQNFYANKLGRGSMELIQKVTSPGKLEDGTPAPYAYGLFVGQKDGYDYQCHGGFDNGWSSFMHRIPEKRCTVACLANHTNSFWPLEVWSDSYSLPEQVMEIVLDDFRISSRPSSDKDKKDSAPAGDFAGVLGRYQDPSDSWLLQIEAREGRATADLGYGRVLELIQVKEAEYQSADSEVTFTFENGKDCPRLIMREKHRRKVFHRFLGPLGREKLSEYQGEYRCEAIRTSYNISAQGHGLLTRNQNRRHNALDFFWSPTIRDTFLAEYPPYCPFYCIAFNRDEAGRVISFVFRDDEERGRENLLFKKV